MLLSSICYLLLSIFERFLSSWVARQPSGFAFIEFEDQRDADDAVHEMNDKEILGCVPFRATLEYILVASHKTFLLRSLLVSRKSSNALTARLAFLAFQ